MPNGASASIWKTSVGTAMAAKYRDPEAGALVLWSVYTVEGIHYLATLDDATFAGEWTLRGHHFEAVDITHMRAAAGGAITALDLCAAALARCFRGPPKKGREADLRTFVKWDPEAGKHVLNPDAPTLPPVVQGWVQAVADDPEYGVMLWARHPLMHGRLRRNFNVTGGDLRTEGHGPRTGFYVDATAIPAREAILRARDFATRHMEGFLVLVANGTLS